MMKSSIFSRCVHIMTSCALILCMICIIFFVHTAPSISNSDSAVLFHTIFWFILTIFIIGMILSVILFLCHLVHFRELQKKVFWSNLALDIYPLLLLLVISGGNVSNVAHLLACPITTFPFFS